MSWLARCLWSDIVGSNATEHRNCSDRGLSFYLSWLQKAFRGHRGMLAARCGKRYIQGRICYSRGYSFERWAIHGIWFAAFSQSQSVSLFCCWELRFLVKRSSILAIAFDADRSFWRRGRVWWSHDDLSHCGRDEKCCDDLSHCWWDIGIECKHESVCVHINKTAGDNDYSSLLSPRELL